MVYRDAPYALRDAPHALRDAPQAYRDAPQAYWGAYPFAPHALPKRAVWPTGMRHTPAGTR
jgi:hypothetical protein